MRARIIIVTAVLSLAGAAASALAASHDRANFIRELDQNADGKVSKDEFAAGREHEFARMDTDKDGGLSHDEYVADFKSRLEKRLEAWPADKRAEQRDRELRQVEVRFGILDSDKSGKITRPEFAHSGWMMFSMHDANRDGFVGPDDPEKKSGD